MKKKLLYVVFLIFLSGNIFGQSVCTRTTNFGNISLCLPKVEDKIECYLKPGIKEYVDYMSYRGNTTIGFYLRKSDYTNIMKQPDEGIDDYIVVSVVNSLASISVDNSILEDAIKPIKGNSVKKSWDKISKEMEKKSFNGENIANPNLISEYSLTKNSKTLVLLSSMKIEGEIKYILMSLNFIVLKKRLININYYSPFKNEKSLETLKKKNDQFIMDINQKNK